MNFIDTTNIESLISWWRSNKLHGTPPQIDIKPDYLCLLVSGGLKFDNFFRDFAKQLQAFDLVTGKNIGFFLYDKQVRIFLKTGFNKNHELGLARKDNPNITRTELFGYYTLAETNKPKGIEELLESTYIFSKKIIEYFELDVQEIPCIIILSRDSPDNKWLVHLRSEIQLNSIYSFFQTVTDIANHEKKIKAKKHELDLIPRRIEEQLKESQYFQDELRKNNENVAKCRKSIIEISEDIRKQLELKLMKTDFLNQYINTLLHSKENKIYTTNISRLSSDELRVRKKEAIEKFGSNIFSILKKELKRFEELLKEDNLLKNMLRPCLVKLENLKSIDLEKEYKEIKIKLEELSNDLNKTIFKYNLLFSAKSKYRKVKEFVQELFSWIKYTKESKIV